VIFYDMDGVLFDTKNAVREAYNAVGLNADNAKGRTWREWLIPKYGVDTAYRLHRNKNERYIELIERGAVDTLPAFRDMVYGIDKALHNGVPSNIGIATSASKEATRALLKQFLTADQISALRCVVFEAGYVQKKHTLLANTPFEYGGVVLVDRYAYVDDNEEAGCGIVSEVNERLGYPVWEFLHFDLEKEL
jgi:phosphoglycolate phosphatase-like HAD superfamily hydrolase